MTVAAQGSHHVGQFLECANTESPAGGDLSFDPNANAELVRPNTQLRHDALAMTRSDTERRFDPRCLENSMAARLHPSALRSRWYRFVMSPRESELSILYPSGNQSLPFLSSHAVSYFPIMPHEHRQL